MYNIQSLPLTEATIKTFNTRMNKPIAGTSGMINCIVASFSSATARHTGSLILAVSKALKNCPSIIGTKSQTNPNTIMNTITESPRKIRLDNLPFTLYAYSLSFIKKREGLCVVAISFYNSRTTNKTVTAAITMRTTIIKLKALLESVST